MDQPDKVANPARGQLNRESEHFPVPVRAPENLVSRDGFGLLISILRLNLVLTYGIPPEFRGGVHLFIYNRPDFINCVPMAFTAESPPAQAQ